MSSIEELRARNAALYQKRIAYKRQLAQVQMGQRSTATGQHQVTFPDGGVDWARKIFNTDGSGQIALGWQDEAGRLTVDGPLATDTSSSVQTTAPVGHGNSNSDGTRADGGEVFDSQRNCLGYFRGQVFNCEEPVPKRLRFGYVLARYQFDRQYANTTGWGRNYLSFKLPDAGITSAPFDQQALLNGLSFAVMVDKATIAVSGFSQAYTYYTTPLGNPAFSATFSKAISYQFYLARQSGVSELFEDSRERTERAVMPSGGTYPNLFVGNIPSERINYSAVYKELFPSNYYAAPVLGVPAQGGAVALPAVFNSFKSYQPSIPFGFLNPVSASLAYYLAYPSADTPYPVKIKDKAFKLPKGKLFRVDVGRDKTTETFVQDYEPSITLAELGIPDYLQSELEGCSITLDLANYVLNPDNPYSQAGDFQFRLLGRFTIFLSLFNRPGETDPTFGPACYLSFYPAFGVF